MQSALPVALVLRVWFAALDDVRNWLIREAASTGLFSRIGPLLVRDGADRLASTVSSASAALHMRTPLGIGVQASVTLLSIRIGIR
jgi:hypothetical protein